MNLKDYRKKVDMFMTLLIAYFFIICTSFYYLKFNGDFENYIMLTIVMVIALISYYTNITLTLVVTLVSSFTFCSYKLYRNVSSGISIDMTVYYWIIVMVITGILVTTLSKYILELQSEITRLSKENNSLVMIDSLTGLRNSVAFFNELPIYMSMCKRYKTPVAVMIVKFKYSDKLKNIVGTKVFEDILIKCSKTFEDSLRFEDRKYILNEDGTFAYILVSEKEGCEIIKNRFNEGIKNISIDKNELFSRIKLEIQIGYYIYNEEVKDALDFVNKAEMELDYDV